MTDLGDPKQVKKQKRTIKNVEIIARAELQALLEQRAFRNFLWTTLEDCRISQISYNGDWGDTAYNEGHRNVGNKLIARIEGAVPHSYMRIYTENRKDDHA